MNAVDRPIFLYFIIMGEAILFFSFGIPQLYQIFAPPSRYVIGEYILSLISKGLLGMILLTNVLLYDRFEDAVDGKNRAVDLETFVHLHKLNSYCS